MKLMIQALDFDGYQYNNIDMQGQEEQVQSNSLNYSSGVKTSKGEKLKSAISLSETMPASKLSKNLIGLTTLAPEIEDVLLEKVDQPLQIEQVGENHVFLKTEFNRDGDSYRSPLTNSYYPPVEGGYVPSGEFRRIQQLGNLLFGEYVKMYYGNSGVGSFFVMEGQSADKFTCGFFGKKYLEEADGFSGSWDSFNTVDVELLGDEATFSLSTTILLEMTIQNQKQGVVDFTGFLKQSKKQRRKLGKERLQECVVGVGELVEQLQTIMRQHLQAVYICKTKEIIFTTRLEYTVEYEKQRRELAKGLKEIHLSG